MLVVRVEFIFNGYLKSVKGFIDEYHQMIHRAAGYHALRMHLLVSHPLLLGANVLIYDTFRRCCQGIAS